MPVRTDTLRELFSEGGQIQFVIKAEDLKHLAELLAASLGNNGKRILTMEETHEIFHIPMSNLKNLSWRKKNNFPTIQNRPYERALFDREAVEQWLADNTEKKGTLRPLKK